MSRAENPGCLGIVAAMFGIKPRAQNSPAQLRDDSLSARPQPQAKRQPYRLRDDFLSHAEHSFYHVIQSTVGEEFTVCPKVNLADIFFVSHPNENYAARAKIDRKHVDFLVCDMETMRPRVGIELDDSSHSSQKRKGRDAFVDEVFKTAGLPLLRFPVQHAYTVSDVSAQLSAILNTPPAATLEAKLDDATATPICPKCGIPLVIRDGKRGQFYGCSNYPRCRQTVSIS